MTDSPKKIRALVVDDEPLARRGIRCLLQSVQDIEIVGEASNGQEAIAAVEKQKPDLVFLDIQMPLLDGFSAIEKIGLANLPEIVFVTAFDEHAIRAFEINALDYLLKPITYERFLKAVVKVKDYIMLLESQVAADEPIDYLFIRSENKFEKISFREIQYVQAMQNYVVIQTPQRRFITHITLKSIEQMLPKKRFVKTHKSYIVSLEKIDRITTKELEIGAAKIPISRSLRDEVMALILDANLVTRENKKPS